VTYPDKELQELLRKLPSFSSYSQWRHEESQRRNQRALAIWRPYIQGEHVYVPCSICQKNTKRIALFTALFLKSLPSEIICGACGTERGHEKQRETLYQQKLSYVKHWKENVEEAFSSLKNKGEVTAILYYDKTTPIRKNGFISFPNSIDISIPAYFVLAGPDCYQFESSIQELAQTGLLDLLCADSSGSHYCFREDLVNKLIDLVQGTRTVVVDYFYPLPFEW